MTELTAQVASHYLFSSLKNQYDDLTNISTKISRQSPDEIIDFLGIEALAPNVTDLDVDDAVDVVDINHS